MKWGLYCIIDFFKRTFIQMRMIYLESYLLSSICLRLCAKFNFSPKSTLSIFSLSFISSPSSHTFLIDSSHFENGKNTENGNGTTTTSVDCSTSCWSRGRPPVLITILWWLYVRPSVPTFYNFENKQISIENSDCY